MRKTSLAILGMLLLAAPPSAFLAGDGDKAGEGEVQAGRKILRTDSSDSDRKAAISSPTSGHTLLLAEASALVSSTVRTRFTRRFGSGRLGPLQPTACATPTASAFPLYIPGVEFGISVAPQPFA